MGKGGLPDKKKKIVGPWTWVGMALIYWDAFTVGELWIHPINADTLDKQTCRVYRQSSQCVVTQVKQTHTGNVRCQLICDFSTSDFSNPAWPPAGFGPFLRVAELLLSPVVLAGVETFSTYQEAKVLRVKCVIDSL